MSTLLPEGTASPARQTDRLASAHLVERHRLTELLAVEMPLVLVVAPAGSGKTVAVAAWAAQHCGPLAWASIERTDLAGAAPWAVVVAALRGAGVQVPALLSLGDRDERGRAFHTMLGAHIAAHPEAVVLVVDSDGPVPVALADGLERVLRESQGQLRLVILCRTEPPVPLLLHRLDGSVTEIRASDLAFREDEVVALLDGAGLVASPERARSLRVRTGGWPEGLRLEVLDAIRRGAAAPTSWHAPVAEYLRTEVLDELPAADRRLLLDCSVIDELPAGLVDALGGSTHGLERLGPAFLAESPGRPGAFALPQLVREALYAELVAEDADRARDLHRRAAGWLAGTERWDEAIAQAVRADAWPDVARYAVDSGLVADLLLGPLSAARTAALAPMPPDTPGVDAALVRAALAVSSGDFASASVHVADAQTCPAPVHGSRFALVLLELVVASGTGDAAGVLTAADRVEPMVTRPDVTAAIEARRGDALLMQGCLEDAAAAYRASEVRHGRLALVEALCGELRAAQALAERVLAAPGPADPCAQIAAAWASAESDDLSAAQTHLRCAGRAPVTAADPVPGTLRALVDARLRRASGDPEGARDALAVPPGGPSWLADLLLLEHAALDLATGRISSALDRHASLADPTSTGAQRLLWQARLAEWAAASRNPPEGGSRADRVGSWLLEASRRLSLGEPAAARRAVRHARTLAAPEQLRRPFREAPADVRRLLLEEPTARPGARAARRQTPGPSVPVDEPVRDLVEPLTEKEREVLGHLAAMLSTDEIAGAMFVSVNTVRTHVRNILRKLGAARRNEAVRRARAMHLIPT